MAILVPGPAVPLNVTLPVAEAPDGAKSDNPASVGTGNGSWASPDVSPPGITTVFNFNDDRTLLIKPGDAELDPDKKAQYILSGDEIKITYTSSPDGSLSLNMRKRDKKTVTIKMHYVLEEDLLQITDEYEVTLTLLRRP